MNTKTALELILNSVDYTTGKCRPNEMIGAVLPSEILKMANEAIDSIPTSPEDKERALIEIIKRSVGLLIQYKNQSPVYIRGTHETIKDAERNIAP